MVPHESQQRPQLYEQLTWNSDEQILNKWPKTLFGCKNGHFFTKKGSKTGQKFWCRNFKFIFSLTRPSMIGSPERVKIQRSLVQNLSKIQQRLKIVGRFLTFWGVKITPDGHNKFWGSKLHQKWIHSNVEILSVQIFSKIWQLLKITI